VAAIFLQEGLAIAALGVTLGWIAALATARLLAAWLYGVGAMDPLTFVAAPALLALVAGRRLLPPRPARLQGRSHGGAAQRVAAGTSRTARLFLTAGFLLSRAGV
jgi:hypothetical protein